MARRKREAEHENHERWLVSYADFITLLFAFFVVMFATSQTDKSKAQAVQDSVTKALSEGKLSSVITVLLGGSPVDKRKGGLEQIRGTEKRKQPGQEIKPGAHVAQLLPSMQLLQTQLQEEIRTGRIHLSMEARGLVISFRQAALFGSGNATLEPGALPTLQKVSAVLRQIPNPVRLEGHTDSVPIHNAQYQSNWDLSAARSIALLRVLTEQYKVPDDQLSIAGYADTEPADSNETEEGRSRNRRVDIVVLNETGVAAEPASSKPEPVGSRAPPPAKH